MKENSGFENSKKEEIPLSEEFKEKSFILMGQISSNKKEFEDLIKYFSENKIPANKYDKSMMERGLDFKEDKGFNIYTEKLKSSLDNLKWGEANQTQIEPSLIIKETDNIIQQITNLYDRFNSSGYSFNDGEKGDENNLKKDFPEIANLCIYLGGKIAEIRGTECSLKNRLNAQQDFKRITDKTQFFRGNDYISNINIIEKNNSIDPIFFYSLNVGIYRNPEELINNLELYISDLPKRIDSIKKNFDNESEVNKRIYSTNEVDKSAKEYLDEFKKIMNKTNK